MTRAALALGFCASLALAPACAGASDAGDALELAARIAAHGAGEAKVYLHAVPPDFAPSVPLPHATLLGSVVPSGSGFSAGFMRIDVANVAYPVALYYDAPDRGAVVSAYESALGASGWKRVADFTSRLPFQSGGFTMQIPHNDMWCAPGSAPQTMVSVQQPVDDASALTVDVSTGTSVAMLCGNAGMPFPLNLSYPKSPLPTFTGRDGVGITSGGPAIDGTTTGARITSSLGLAAVFETFAKQLRDAGWSPAQPAASPATRSQTFTKTVDGKPYTALLTVYTLDATHYVALTDVSTS